MTGGALSVRIQLLTLLQSVGSPISVLEHAAAREREKNDSFVVGHANWKNIAKLSGESTGHDYFITSYSIAIHLGFFRIVGKNVAKKKCTGSKKTNVVILGKYLYCLVHYM